MVGVGQVAADDGRVHDPEFVEYGLGEHELDSVGCFGEEAVGVDQDAEGVIEALLDGVQGDGQLGDDFLGCRYFIACLVLLQLEVFEAERIGVVGFLVLLASLLEFLDAFLLGCNFSGSVSVLAFEGLDDGIAQLLQPCFRETHVFEVIGDGCFYFGHRYVGLFAAVLVLLPAQAVEVGVGRTVAVGGGGNAEAPAAAGTEQVSFEGMGAPLALFLVEVAGGQDGLHHIEYCFIDQRFVSTLIGHAVVGDDAGVVAVAQDAVDVRNLHGAFGQAFGFGHAQAEVVEFVGQGTEGVEAGDVERESFGDDRPHDLINHYQANVFTLAFVADVSVAERCLAGSTADLGFFAEALAGFLAEITGVKLGNGRHDTVDQFSAWCFVDVLSGGHQLDAVFGECDANLYVIFPVPGQAVELVHDDVADIRILGYPL